MWDEYLEMWKGCPLLITLLTLLLFFGVGCLIAVTWNEIDWARTPKISWPAKLINTQHLSSTLQTTTMPIVGVNGQVSVGMATSGNAEQFITIWDCGKYGRLVTDDERIFRFATPAARLWIKVRGEDVRIVGIMEPRR